MSMQDWALAYIALAFVAANLPWLSSRLFFFRATAGDKALQWYLLEWLVMYFIVGIIGMGIEHSLEGQNHDQGWEFYVVALCMFAVFAIPGFIWRFNVRPMLRRS
ncbi:DUF2818 family protein [Acidithiobacillus sp.]|jgi:hypothetical protein|uniref:DUF2818 family protein n=1 Tax=Acidithiobacillus sp. TaxID=1872118 RepID=UPI002631E169|nr:DUF2818 family protein [Acidithiobacillus sp.]